MDVVIDGVKYLPAKQVLANRDAIIRGLMSEYWGDLMSEYWGDLPDEYDEKDTCEDIFVSVNDCGDGIPLLKMADIISEYAQRYAK